MKALTLTQPWATLVANGSKRVETRSWRTRYTGRIAIHAAKGYPKDAKAFAEIERGLGRLPSRIPLAAVIALATLRDCRPTEEAELELSGLERHLGNYSPGRWAWFLDDVTELAHPIPCRGMLSLWEVPPEVAAQIGTQA